MTSKKVSPGFVGDTATWLLTLALLLPLGAALMAAFSAERSWDELRVGSLLLDTAVFAGLSALVGVVGGYIIARAGLFWAALACVPLALPSSLLASAWIVTLGRTGPLGDWVTVFDRLSWKRPISFTDSSRASTARCTLPPERFSMNSSVDGVLTR